MVIAVSLVSSIACYKVFLRRKQSGALKYLVLKNPLFTKTVLVLAQLTARDNAKAAAPTGEAASVYFMLGEAGINDDFKKILMLLQIVQRSAKQ